MLSDFMASAFIYLLCKSYQDTRKIMQKAQKKKNIPNKKNKKVRIDVERTAEEQSELRQINNHALSNESKMNSVLCP